MDIIYILLISFVITSICVLLKYFKNEEPYGEYSIPKIIWVFWDKELPSLVEKIRKRNEEILISWKINFLNNETIYKFIEKEEFPKNFYTLSVQHKSDWIRLALLNKYGGVWLDSSIIINDNNALNKLREYSYSKKSQFTGFSFRNYEPDMISDKNISLYIENWFIMAPVNSIVIKEWFFEFEKAIQFGFINYKTFLKNEGINTSKYFREDIDDVYLTQHGCLQFVLQKKLDKPSIIIMPAENDMLSLHHYCKNDSTCVMNEIKNNSSEVRKIPYIKLTGKDRNIGVDINNYFV